MTMSANQEARTRTKTDATSRDTKTEKARPAKAVGKAKEAPKAGRKKPGKVGALDAAARVLEEEGRAMHCQELIEAMAAKGYWKSPAGRTPSATLYAGLIKEIAAKGDASRFAKVDRGQFTRRGARS
jgi:hypothetical protein